MPHVVKEDHLQAKKHTKLFWRVFLGVPLLTETSATLWGAGGAATAMSVVPARKLGATRARGVALQHTC